MREHMERLVILPFSLGCVSESSIAVSTSQLKKTKPKPKPKPESYPPGARRQEGEESSSAGLRMNHSFGFLELPKPNISNGIHRLIRRFKSFSQLFVFEEVEMEKEMEIGFPTDVKHVTHIGWDGSTTTNPVKGWENLKAPEILAFPSISLRQFELAMAAQADGPLVVGSSKLGH